MRHYYLKGHLCALGAAVLFGLMSPMCKFAMQNKGVDALQLAFFRVCGAAILFWLISLLIPREKIAGRDWLPLLGMTLCGMLINQFLYVLGIQYTSPGNACVIGTSTPVMTFILSVLFLRQRVTWGRTCGFLLAFAGAAVLIQGSGGDLSGHPLGDTLCLISQLAAACYFVFFGRVLRRYHPITVMKWLFLMATLLSLIPMWHSLSCLEPEQLHLHELFAITYIVVGGSFFSYLLLIVAQRRLAPPSVAAYNYVQPVIAVATGVFLNLDLLTGQKLFSFLLIAVGVVLVSSRDKS